MHSRSLSPVTIAAALIGVAVTLSILGGGIIEGREDILTALLPLPFFLWWFAHERLPRGWNALIWTVALIAMIGSATGNFRDPAWINRCTHGLMAGITTVILFIEVKARFAPLWRITYLCAGSLLVAIGALLEISEAAVSWDSHSGQTRWHDTILDLVANCAGAAVALIGIWCFFRFTEKSKKKRELQEGLE